MKENGKSQTHGIKLPPAWCGALCKNAMNEVCIEHCAIVRDCSGFEMKPGIDLIDMPRFPIDDVGQMTKEEKFISVAVYIAKTVDHLKGVQDEPTTRPLRRPNHDSSTSSEVPSDQQSQDLLHGSKTAVTLFEAGEKRPGETIGPTEVARKSD